MSLILSLRSCDLTNLWSRHLFLHSFRVTFINEASGLLQGFEKLEVERIGVGKHEEFHKLLHKLQDIYLKQL